MVPKSFGRASKAKVKRNAAPEVVAPGFTGSALVLLHHLPGNFGFQFSGALNGLAGLPMAASQGFGAKQSEGIDKTAPHKQCHKADIVTYAGCLAEDTRLLPPT